MIIASKTINAFDHKQIVLLEPFVKLHILWTLEILSALFVDINT